MRSAKIALLALLAALTFEVAARGGPSTAAKELKKRELLLQLLDGARKDALAAINDAANYRSEDHGRSGQKQVDELVQKVREPYATARQLLDRDLAQVLKASESKRRAFLEQDPQTLSTWERAVRRAWEDNEILKKNESLARPPKGGLKAGVLPTDHEREQTRLTNEYRMLMGLRALEIDPRLVQCARGHSNEMTRLRFFAHESPTPENRTVGMRTEKVGVKDVTVGENICQGYHSPKAAFDGWYHSAGHHRNVVSTEWFFMGVGRDGENWTQNFAGK